MNSLLFVDDDIFILESVLTILDWKRLSFGVPYTASSYEQAIEVFDRTQIDILVSDIEMLGYSGIDLISWARRNRPRTLCCFLTCHAQFSYAQRAIELGAVGYLLKPINAADLEELLSNCVSKLTQTEKPIVPADKQAELSSFVQLAISYINRNYAGAINREMLSQELCVSERKLTQFFNQEVGMSITDYITECRLTCAIDLLTSTNLTITEISERVGYNYPAHFAKTFREKTGKTPHQFRVTKMGEGRE
ncbi:MAG: helix-turn-helix domain-containing protein [Oscillospiraceae bacterium]|nr:helix-turn-helix domain-containing protein [Oscillospiraceae bacterium]